MILFKEIEKEYIDEFFKKISEKMGVEKKSLDILFKYFKEDLFFLLSFWEGKKINFLSVESLKDLYLKIKIDNFLKEEEYKNLNVEEKLNRIKDKLDISINKIIKLMNDKEL